MIIIQWIIIKVAFYCVSFILTYMPPQMKFNVVPKVEPVETIPEEKVLRQLPKGYEFIPGGNGAYRLAPQIADDFASMSANDAKYLVDLDEYGRRKLPKGYRYIGKSSTYELDTNDEKAPAGIKPED